MKHYLHVKVPIVIDTELSSEELSKRIRENNIAGIKSVSFIADSEDGTSGTPVPIEDRILTSIFINSSIIVY